MELVFFVYRYIFVSEMATEASEDEQVGNNGFARTSDIFGSHVRTDLEAYLSLIRRKIQAKCGTTQDLIQQIRRNKIGDSGHVTPNEFRYTLIKFGVILPQPLVDRIFNVFDSDRSGTMDFDEFAMWIMNSEFRPPIVETEPPAVTKARITNRENEKLRVKLNKCIKLNDAIFRALKRSVSFTEWVSLINRGNMPMTEREARAVFMLFDPTDTGFMGTNHLLKWAETGDLTPPPPSASSKEIIRDISLKEAIRKVAGKNLQMVERSFAHMPFNKGSKIPFEEFRRCLLTNGLGRNILETRQLFNALGGKQGTADIDQLMREVTDKNIRGPVDPQAAVSMKKERNQTSNLSAADRALREALRKSYGPIKAAIEQQDRAGTGFIDATELHKVLLKLCIPLTFQDFRYTIEHIISSDNGGKVNIVHFLEAYNPRHLPHQLAGGQVVINEAASRTQIMSPISHNRNVGSASGSSGRFNESQSTSNLSITGGNNNNNNMMMNKISGNNSKSSGTLSINEDLKKVDPSGELRRIWQNVLRECHRKDPDRSGTVNRIAFINALEVSNAKSVMSPETMSKLADKYDAGFGLINYLACFRNYLTAMTSTAIAPEFKDKSANQSKAEIRENRALHPWEFSYQQRTRHSAVPYWSSAASAPKDVNAPIIPAAVVPDANHRNASQLSDQEKSILIGKYEPKVLQACRKVYYDLGKGGPQWKELRNRMKVAQINSQRGCILTTNWYKLAEEYNVKLGINGMNALVRAFRGLGNQDVIKYNDLVRICTIVGTS